MIKNRMKNQAIGIIMVVFIVNVIFIILYCNFFLNRSLSYSLDEAKKEVDTKTKEIVKSLEKEEITKESIEKITEDYDIELSISVENELIYSNISKQNFYYSTQNVLNINNKNYYLVTSKGLDVSITLIITILLLVELIIILLITFSITYIINKRLLRPIVFLRHDIKSYKKGIIPKERPKEEDLYGLHQDFVSLTKALEQEKLKHNEVIASISHDIKTPLTSIIGYTQRLENANLTEEVKKKYISKIESKALVIKDIMNEFDEYLVGFLSDNLNKTPIITNELFNMLESDYKEDLKDKKIILILENNVKKETMFIDISKIKRVFSNIISNSVRHITNKNGKIKIVLNKIEDYYEFRIEDNGEGIKEENLSKIFNPLFTTDPSRKISGLGLSICKGIVELHEGTIKAINNKAKGVTIIFTIKA